MAFVLRLHSSQKVGTRSPGFTSGGGKKAVIVDRFM
jgi:hypothetical protein